MIERRRDMIGYSPFRENTFPPAMNVNAEYTFASFGLFLKTIGG